MLFLGSRVVETLRTREDFEAPEDLLTKQAHLGTQLGWVTRSGTGVTALGGRREHAGMYPAERCRALRGAPRMGKHWDQNRHDVADIIGQVGRESAEKVLECR